MKAAAVALLYASLISSASAQDHYLALAYSSRQVYIVSNGGTLQQCMNFIRSRKDRAHYACIRYSDVKEMLRAIFGDTAAESL